MNTFTMNQLQSVIDSYSIGKIEANFSLNKANFEYKGSTVSLNREFIETNQGLYLLVFSENNSLHSAWWESSESSFADLLSKSNKIKNCKLLLNNSNVDTVHKYDYRFCLFAL